ALDLLSSEGLEVDAGGHSIHRAVFESGSRRAAFSLTHEPVMRVFAREVFDSALLDAAAEAGTTRVPSRATAIERNGTGWAVRTARGTVRVHWLIGADGPTGIV